MGHFIIKPEPDKDFYVVWSTIVDDLICCGTAAEIKQDLLEEARKRAEEEVATFLDRGVHMADELGTSSGYHKGAWAAKHIRVGGSQLIRRERLAEYARLMCSDRAEEAVALLEQWAVSDD